MDHGPAYNVEDDDDFSEDNDFGQEYFPPSELLHRTSSNHSSSSERITIIPRKRKNNRIPEELLQYEHFLQVSPSEGKEYLQNQRIGSFLVRASKTKTCYCTLMVNTKNGVASIQMVKIDGKFCFYSENVFSDKRFSTLDGLIQWHTRHEIPCEMKGILLRDYKSSENRGSSFA